MVRRQPHPGVAKASRSPQPGLETAPQTPLPAGRPPGRGQGAGVRRKNVPWIPAMDLVCQHYRQSVGLQPIALITHLTRRET